MQHFREWGWTGAPSNLPPTATDPGVADKAGPAKQRVGEGLPAVQLKLVTKIQKFVETARRGPLGPRCQTG